MPNLVAGSPLRRAEVTLLGEVTALELLSHNVVDSPCHIKKPKRASPRSASFGLFEPKFSKSEEPLQLDSPVVLGDFFFMPGEAGVFHGCIRITFRIGGGKDRKEEHQIDFHAKVYKSDLLATEITQNGSEVKIVSVRLAASSQRLDPLSYFCLSWNEEVLFRPP